MSKTLTASYLLSTDTQLKENKEFQELHSKYSKPASDESLDKTVKTLTEKGHKAYVVEGKDDFMKLIQTLVPDGASIYSGSSTTLQELGFVEYLKANPTKYVNHKAAFVAASSKGDQAGMADAVAKGWLADYWFASVGAISETGEIVWGSATGTRLAPHTPKNLVLVAGTNKITADLEDALKRLKDYQKTLTDGEARAFGLSGSTLAEIGVLSAANPFGAPGRVHVIFVKGVYGY